MDRTIAQHSRRFGGELRAYTAPNKPGPEVSDAPISVLIPPPPTTAMAQQQKKREFPSRLRECLYADYL